MKFKSWLQLHETVQYKYVYLDDHAATMNKLLKVLFQKYGTNPKAQHIVLGVRHNMTTYDKEWMKKHSYDDICDKLKFFHEVVDATHLLVEKFIENYLDPSYSIIGVLLEKNNQWDQNKLLNENDRWRRNKKLESPIPDFCQDEYPVFGRSFAKAFS